MYENIKAALDRLVCIPEFLIQLKEFRFRFGIPEAGFSDSSSEGYKNWVRERLKNPDYVKDQFLFIAKRCRNLIPDSDPIPIVILAYYFMFGMYLSG